MLLLLAHNSRRASYGDERNLLVSWLEASRKVVRGPFRFWNAGLLRLRGRLKPSACSKHGPTCRNSQPHCSSCAAAVHARRTHRRGRIIFAQPCRRLYKLLTISDIDAYLLTIITFFVLCSTMSVGHESASRRIPCILGSFDLGPQLCWREVSLTIDEIRDVAASRTRFLIAYGILLCPALNAKRLTKSAIFKVSRRG